jgi:hypothetical protein
VTKIAYLREKSAQQKLRAFFFTILYKIIDTAIGNEHNACQNSFYPKSLNHLTVFSSPLERPKKEGI